MRQYTLDSLHTALSAYRAETERLANHTLLQERLRARSLDQKESNAFRILRPSPLSDLDNIPEHLEYRQQCDCLANTVLMASNSQKEIEAAICLARLSMS